MHSIPQKAGNVSGKFEPDGAAVAAKDLGLNVSQLYSWRAKDRTSGQVSEEQRLAQ